MGARPPSAINRRSASRRRQQQRLRWRRQRLLLLLPLLISCESAMPSHVIMPLHQGVQLRLERSASIPVPWCIDSICAADARPGQARTIQPVKDPGAGFSEPVSTPWACDASSSASHPARSLALCELHCCRVCVQAPVHTLICPAAAAHRQPQLPSAAPLPQHASKGRISTPFHLLPPPEILNPPAPFLGPHGQCPPILLSPPHSSLPRTSKRDGTRPWQHSQPPAQRAAATRGEGS
jgi:hypothetical protein